MKDHIVSNDSSATSRSLLDQAARGNAEAWEQLAELHAPLLRYWCYRRGLSENVSEDVVQDVLFIAFQKLDRFEHNGRKGAFRSWLRTITTNRISDLRKSDQPGGQGVGGSDNQRAIEEVCEKVPGEVDQVEDSPDNETAILYQTSWTLIRGEFSERDNEIFRRVIENGERPKDVAEDLNITANTVSIAVARIKKRVRERLGDALEA